MKDASSLPQQYWSQPSASLLAALHTTPDGLTTAEAHQRLKICGPTASCRRLMGGHGEPVNER
jgi:hypothetical protein